jgi:hypothetical protein
MREKLAVIWRQGLVRPVHKIGGEPDWIQGEARPEYCGQPTIYYTQLGKLGGKYDLSDSGWV